MSMKIQTTFLVVVAVLATPMMGLSPVKRAPAPEQKVGDWLDGVRLDLLASRAATNTEDAAEKLSQQPAGGIPSSGFGDRINSSVQNFLPFFEGLVEGTSVTDDKKGLVVRFNPIREPDLFELGLTATIVEPSASEELLARLKEVNESAIPAEREAIVKGLDDFSDITWAATLAPIRKPTALNDGSRWYLGRNPRSYERVLVRLDKVAIGKLPPETGRAELDEYVQRIRVGLGLPEDFDLKTLFQTVKGSQVTDFLSDSGQAFYDLLVQKEARIVAAANRYHEVADAFVSLVGNQPQLSITASYRDRHDLGGRTSWTVNVSYDQPLRANINRLLKRSKTDDEFAAAFREAQQDLADVAKADKLTFTATYTSREDLDLTYTPVTSGIEPVTLILEAADELAWKLTYSRNLARRPRPEGTEGSPSKLLLSAEYIDISDTEDKMKQDRLVATLTYDVPVSGAVSFPISLVYANHSEFLGDPDKQLSAHFGLSYRWNESK